MVVTFRKSGTKAGIRRPLTITVNVRLTDSTAAQMKFCHVNTFLGNNSDNQIAHFIISRRRLSLERYRVCDQTWGRN